MAYGFTIRTGSNSSPVDYTVTDLAPGLLLESFTVAPGATVNKDYSSTFAGFLTAFHDVDSGWDDSAAPVINQPILPAITINQSARTVSVTNPLDTSFNTQPVATIHVFGS